MVRIGQEISLGSRKKKVPYLRYVMAAASFLVIIMTGQLYMASAPRAAAYMTIDINPSIELAASRDGVVISGSGLNSDGERLLSEVKVKGFNLDQAVGLIVTQAIADNYMTKAQDNVVLTTLTVAEGSDPLVDLEFVYRAIKTSMDSGGVSSEVIIETVSPELRKEAAAAGISTGRVLLHKRAIENNLAVSDAEIGTMNLSKMEKDKKISIVGLMEDSRNTKVYNLDKGEGSPAVKQGIYADRNNANIRIKSKQENGNNMSDNDGKNQNENKGTDNMNQSNSKK
jgi:hypothetical protein